MGPKKSAAHKFICEKAINLNSSGTYRLLFKKYPDVVDVNQLSQMLNINLNTAYKLLLDKKIDAHDIIFLNEKTRPTVGWINKTGEKVIINNQKCTGTYTFKNDNMYQAWKKKIKRFAKIGNRYKCIKTLVINAVKCDVPKDVLLQDIEILIDFFNMDPGAVINPFTEHDIECALAFYDERFKRTSVHSINSDFGSDVLERTKRNGKSMKEHVSEVMNVERDKSYPNGSWRGSGRKKGSTKDVTTSSKAQAIKEFLLKNEQSVIFTKKRKKIAKKGSKNLIYMI